jgi:hypothetical protein
MSRDESHLSPQKQLVKQITCFHCHGLKKMSGEKREREREVTRDGEQSDERE